jgi:hypothetical protein
MKQVDFEIPLYDFGVTFVEIEGAADADKIDGVFNDMKIEKDVIEQTRQDIANGCKNGGDTYRAFSMKKFLVVIYPCESIEKRRNIVAHESRHVADRILEWASITDIEAAAFLQGYIAQYIY